MCSNHHLTIQTSGFKALALFVTHVIVTALILTALIKIHICRVFMQPILFGSFLLVAFSGMFMVNPATKIIML
jgi:hypothetical protein